MLIWIENVWKPFTEGKPVTYLIIDEFSAHMTSAVLDRFAELGTEMDLVIGGYTSKLQTLDVGVNKPFKGYLRSQFEAFMVTNPDKTPHRLDVAHWIEYAWNSISLECIVNTWGRIGIGRNACEAARALAILAREPNIEAPDGHAMFSRFDIENDNAEEHKESESDSESDSESETSDEEEPELSADEIRAIQSRIANRFSISSMLNP